MALLPRELLEAAQRGASLAASLLRGDVTTLDALAGDAEAFLSATTAHGVDGLVRWHLKQQGVWSAVPAGVRAALDERARRDAVVEAVRRREMAQLLAGLQNASVDVLVLKGWGLAYTHYPGAYMRPRSDIDLLVRRADVERAMVQLEALRYVRQISVARDAVHKQVPFERRTGSIAHHVDLHWAISNRPLFADMLSFDELVLSAVPVKPLGDDVLTPGPVHALLLACIHRIAHHDDSDLLCWLYDIRLLADRLSPAEWNLVNRLIAQKQIAAICHQGLTLAARRVGCGPVALERITALEPPAHAPPEPSATYLGGVGTGLRSFALDVKATAGLTAKLRLLAGHAFPDARYMQDAHGVTNRLTLTTAYVRRGVRGLWRTLRGTRVR